MKYKIQVNKLKVILIALINTTKYKKLTFT